MKKKTDKYSKKLNNPVTYAIVAGAVFTIVITTAILVSRSANSFPNLYIGEIAVGNMNSQEIADELKLKGWTAKNETPITVNSFSGATCEIDPCAAGLLLNTSDVVDKVLFYGKNGSILDNLLCYIRCLFSKVDLNTSREIVDSEYIGACFNSIQGQLDEFFSYDSFRIDGEKLELVVKKGYGSTLKLDRNAFEESIVSAAKEGIKVVTFLQLEEEPEYPDLEIVRNFVCTGPKDASFSTDGSHDLVETVPGYRFEDSSLKKCWDSAEPGDDVRIPLTAEYSDINSEYLRSMMYRDLLGAVTTKYNNSGENRSSNVRLAASLVNGTEIFPGEEFSFNKTVGKRTAEAGFLMAPAYAGYDDIQEELGGGICQVSSGIYASALYSFLEITEHTCHVYPPNYMQLGTDATVSIPASGREIDLKFKNSRNWPVKVVAYCDEATDDRGKPLKTVTVEIWGTLEEDDYMPVEFDNAYADIYDYDRVIEPAYPDREGYRFQFTHDETEFEDDNGKGLRTLTYMRIYDSSGVLVDKRILNRKYSFGYGMDTYYYMGSH